MGQYDVARLLLQVGADVNHKSHARGCTAFSQAMWGGHMEVAELLIEYGAEDTRIVAKEFLHA